MMTHVCMCFSSVGAHDMQIHMDRSIAVLLFSVQWRLDRMPLGCDSSWGRKARARHRPGSLRIDYYDILGVEPSASSADIKAAYKRQALRSHPDKGGSAEKFRLVVKAFEVLFNASLRQSYDRQRERHQHSVQRSTGKGHQHPQQQQHPPQRRSTLGRPQKRTKVQIFARYLNRLRHCLAQCPREIRQVLVSKMSPLLRQKLLELMERPQLPTNEARRLPNDQAGSAEAPPPERPNKRMRSRDLSLEDQAPASPGRRKLYRGVNTLKSRGFLYYEARLSVRSLTLASRATRTLEDAVHYHTLLATFRQIFSEKEASSEIATVEVTARNLQKALEETDGLSNMGLSLQIVMDARPWVGKMVTSPRTQQISQAISMWTRAEQARLEGWHSMRAVWLEWMQMGRRERFNIRSKSWSQAHQTVTTAEHSYQPERRRREERRAAREWRQRQQSQRQEARQQEMKVKEMQRWQRLVEGRLARLLQRAENCAVDLDNKEYGRMIQEWRKKVRLATKAAKEKDRRKHSRAAAQRHSGKETSRAAA